MDFFCFNGYSSYLFFALTFNRTGVYFLMLVPDKITSTVFFSSRNIGYKWKLFTFHYNEIITTEWVFEFKVSIRPYLSVLLICWDIEWNSIV